MVWGSYNFCHQRYRWAEKNLSKYCSPKFVWETEIFTTLSLIKSCSWGSYNKKARTQEMNRIFASSVITSCKLCLKLQVLWSYLAWWSIVRERACILLSASFLTCRLFRMLRNVKTSFLITFLARTSQNFPAWRIQFNSTSLDIDMILASSGCASLNNNREGN